MKIYISHSTSFDYQNELYKPLKDSSCLKEHELILPHAGQEQDSRAIVKTCDLIIAEVSFPSTGQGIELGWAFDAQVPIICICRSGTKPSSSLQYVANAFIEYHSVQDALQEISSSMIANATLKHNPTKQ